MGELIEFQLRELDPRDHQAASGHRFVQSGTFDASHAPDLFVGDDPATREARARFDELTARVQGSPVGDWVLEDVYVMGTRGLIVDRARRTIWHGQSIGWPDEQVPIDLTRSLAATIDGDRGTAALDEELFTRPKNEILPDRPDTGVPNWTKDPTGDEPPYQLASLRLLALPGYAVYGHWLIDVVPRLVRLVDEPEAGPLWYAPTAPWAREIGDLYDVDLTKPMGWAGRLAHVDRMLVPTTIQRHSVMDRTRAPQVWADYERRVRRLPLTDDVSGYGDRLYVSRARWNHPRSLVNAEEVEEVMRARGFSIVHPQDLSLRGQIEVFSRARRVVGEDGSGLHNSIFAGPGVHVTVLCTHDPVNTYHAGIASAARQQISYVGSEMTDAGPVCRLDALQANLDEYP